MVRYNYPKEGTHRGAAIDHGGFLNIFGDRVKVALHEEQAEGQREGGIGEDEGSICPLDLDTD